MKFRRIIGSALIVVALAFTVYLCVIMAHRIRAVVLKDSYIKIFRYELIACAFFLLFALDVRFGLLTGLHFGAARVVGWGLRVLVALIVAALLCVFGKIVAGSRVCTEAPARHAIVLGLALENGKPTGDLLSRLDAAERYLRENPETTLILTGGNADESGKTEAAVMRDLLIKRGAAADRLMLEDRAETTKENFQNVARMIDPAEPVVLISSDYHMDRAVQMAKSAGFAEVLRLPAPSSVVEFGANVMWEVVLELNELTLRQ